MLIDSHAHLGSESFSHSEIEAVLSRAQESQVEHIINIGAGYGLEGNEIAVRIAQQYSQVSATIGIHPHDAKLVTPEVIEQLRRLAKHPKVVAIGEIGLDFYYEHSEPQTQQTVLRQMIQLAHEVDLPISIHVRDAYDLLCQILEEENGYKTGGVIHCFSGDWAFAQKVLEKGFYISFSGIITFKKAVELQEVVKQVPLDRVLVETDSPFLAPEPFRGKRNEPAMVKRVAEKVAELKNLPFEEVVQATAKNTRRLFLKILT